MQIVLRSKNIEITPGLRQHVEKRLRKIAKYFAEPLSAQVALNVERGRHTVEVTIPVNGMILRGQEQTDDMYASIDLVVDKIAKQIDRFKHRFPRRLRAVAAAERDGLTVREGQPVRDGQPALVKTKRFAVKPMNVDEALMHMNLVSHDFFVFVNAESDQVNVVYRRKDGNYGLIEPSL